MTEAEEYLLWTYRSCDRELRLINHPNRGILVLLREQRLVSSLIKQGKLKLIRGTEDQPVKVLVVEEEQL